MRDVAVSDQANFVMRFDDNIPAVRIVFIGNEKNIKNDRDLLNLEHERIEFILSEIHFLSDLISMHGKALLYLNLIDTRKICLKYYETKGCPSCPIAKAGYPDCKNTPFERVIDLETEISMKLTRTNYASLQLALKNSKIFVEQMLKSIDTFKFHMLK